MILIRHAKSSWDNPELDDFDRGLNKRGRRDLVIMREKLSSLLPAEYTVVSSSSHRTKLTCEGLGLAAEFDDSLYHAGCDALSAVCAARHYEENLVLVGHNPGLTSFVNQITQENIENVPTLGICFIEIISLGPVRGRLREFLYPKRYK